MAANKATISAIRRYVVLSFFILPYYNGKNRAKFRNCQNSPYQSQFFYILWHNILKTAKGFGGVEKKSEI